MHRCSYVCYKNCFNILSNPIWTFPCEQGNFPWRLGQQHFCLKLCLPAIGILLFHSLPCRHSVDSQSLAYLSRCLREMEAVDSLIVDFSKISLDASSSSRSNGYDVQLIHQVRSATKLAESMKPVSSPTSFLDSLHMLQIQPGLPFLDIAHFLLSSQCTYWAWDLM